MALTRQILDVMKCNEPDCHHDHTILYLQGACHPDAGANVRYDKSTGLLRVACLACDKLIANVAVADGNMVH